MRNAINLTMCLALLPLIASTAHAGAVCMVENSNGDNLTAASACGSDVFVDWENAVVGYSSVGPPCTLSGCGERRFLWTISRSDTDPFDNSGPLTGPLDELYVWLQCDSQQGSQNALVSEFRIETIGGDIQHVATTPIADGVFNAGTTFEPGLVFGPCTTFLAAYPVLRLTMFVETPVSIEDSSWSAVKALYQ